MNCVYRLEGHPLAIKEYGLQYYDDLQQKISRKEALDIYHHVESVSFFFGKTRGSMELRLFRRFVKLIPI
jgi:hypothetical protein